jgi:hypothetical protein
VFEKLYCFSGKFCSVSISSKTEVQCGHLVASIAISLLQKGQVLTKTASSSFSFKQA